MVDLWNAHEFREDLWIAGVACRVVDSCRLM